jgi:hypothetical protein
LYLRKALIKVDFPEEKVPSTAITGHHGTLVA